MERAEPSDRELLAADPAAGATFAFLTRRHGGVLYAIAYREVGTVHDAEELVQDAFLLLWTKRARLRFVGDSALPWLIVSVKQLAANRRRALQRRARREVPVAALPEHGEQTVDGPAAAVAEVVERAFARLPELDAAVARLCLVEDLSYGDAATRLGLTVSAVRNRLSRSRARLRRDLVGSRDAVGEEER
ncbi:RNA polymerase sigma factor [uncultured Amnibacterium sp.]|uniref:RNA polymerase sigma factor n=1 Tax=uncultured Amnibacterium sp. TaxID=1631851 RepID=UPI0035CC6424